MDKNIKRLQLKQFLIDLIGFIILITIWSILLYIAAITNVEM
jgi:hypothetical protein